MQVLGDFSKNCNYHFNVTHSTIALQLSKFVYIVIQPRLEPLPTLDISFVPKTDIINILQKPKYVLCQGSQSFSIDGQMHLYDQFRILHKHIINTLYLQMSSQLLPGKNEKGERKKAKKKKHYTWDKNLHGTNIKPFQQQIEQAQLHPQTRMMCGTIPLKPRYTWPDQPLGG